MGQQQTEGRISVSTITVSYGGTINIGNFSNVKVEYSITRDLTSEEEFDTVSAIRKEQEKLREVFLRERIEVLTDG